MGPAGSSHGTTLMQELLKKVGQAMSFQDEEERCRSNQFLFMQGAPGSGKSAALIEAAIRCAKEGSTVCIICPTGALVNALKMQLPDFAGVDRIHIDTLHGTLKYKRAKEGEVAWAPPSAFRKYDIIFCDEASQYDDTEWSRMFQTIKATASGRSEKEH